MKTIKPIPTAPGMDELLATRRALLEAVAAHALLPHKVFLGSHRNYDKREALKLAAEIHKRKTIGVA